jgi:hypothetical protein
LAHEKVSELAKSNINPLIEDSVSSLYCRLDATCLKDHIANFTGIKETKPFA